MPEFSETIHRVSAVGIFSCAWISETFHRVENRSCSLLLKYVERLEQFVLDWKTILKWNMLCARIFSETFIRVDSKKNVPAVKICYAPETIHRVSTIGIFWRVVRKTTLKWKYVVRLKRFIFEKRSANGIWQTVAPWNNSCGWKAILERRLPETEWGLGVYALEFD